MTREERYQQMIEQVEAQRRAQATTSHRPRPQMDKPPMLSDDQKSALKGQMRQWAVMHMQRPDAQASRTDTESNLPGQVNRTGNARDGQTYRDVTRNGEHFHVYGSGKNKQTIKLGNPIQHNNWQRRNIDVSGLKK